jgi:hypothetical protein
MVRLLVVLIITVLATSACSRTSFFYHRIPTLINWAIDDYLTLDRQQQVEFDDALDNLLEWHQTEELPKYVDLLDRVIVRMDSSTPLRVEDMATWQAEADTYSEALQLQAVRSLAGLIPTLSATQHQELRQALDKKQAELESKYIDRSDERYRQDAVDNLEDNLSDYLGKLTNTQKADINAAAQNMIRYDSVWLARRKEWFDEFYALVTNPGPDAEAALLAFLTRSERAPAEEYVHNTKLIMQAMVDVLNARTDKQNRKLISKLTNLRDDLATLIVDEPEA